MDPGLREALPGTLEFAQKAFVVGKPSGIEKMRPAEFSPTEVAATKQLLAARNKKRLDALHARGHFKRDTGDYKLETDAKKISNKSAEGFLRLQKGLFQIGGRALVHEFLTTPYCLQFAEDFAGYDASKVALAFHSQKLIDQYAQARAKNGRPIERQFVPALNIGAFVALEKLHQPTLMTKSAAEAAASLRSQAKTSPLWGERNLVTTLANYLGDEKLVGTSTPTERNQRVALKIVEDMHQRLSRLTHLQEATGQSQGIEVEVLQRTTAADVPGWAAEYKLKKFLPRGIEEGLFKRTDWRLLGIMGLHEDLGERLNEPFELSTSPSATASAQTTILYELMLGGFIDERHITNGKENYSLHVSSVFPEEIFVHNDRANKEYVYFSRAMGGAFSTLNRMKFGGWMTSEDYDYEIFWDRAKSTSKLEAVPGKTVSGRQLLVEIRTLDLTEKDQFPALLHKQMLDFGFRTYWEQQLGNPPATSRDLQAASEWQSFMKDLESLNAKYKVPDHWQGTANAREQYPRYQWELQRLIRDRSNAIRNIVELPDSAVTRYETTGLRPIVSAPVEVKAISRIPEDTVLVPQSMLRGMDIRAGGLYTLKVGQTARTITVQPTYEAGIGYNPALNDYLHLPQDITPRVKFDPDRREIALGPVVGIAFSPDGDTAHPVSSLLRWPVISAELMAAKRAGVIAYAFNPKDFDPVTRTVSAYSLADARERPIVSEKDYPTFTRTTAPLPDIIYDWSYEEWRDEEKNRELVASSMILNERSVGEESFDKIQFYENMRKNPAIRNHLPETMEYSTPKDIDRMLSRHDFVVMKPEYGEEGEAIFYIRRGEGGAYLVSNPHWQSATGKEEDEQWVIPEYSEVRTLSQLMKIVTRERDKHDYSDMILQQGVDMMKLPERVFPESRDHVEIRSVVIRDSRGELTVLGEKEKRQLWTDRLSKVVSRDRAQQIAANAQALSKLTAMQIAAETGTDAINMLAVDVLVDKNGNVWLAESNIMPTMLWYNNPKLHPRLLNDMGYEYMKACAVQTGFAPRR